MTTADFMRERRTGGMKHFSPQPAVGHMPFAYHRTQQSVMQGELYSRQRMGNARIRRAQEYGLEGY